MIRWRTGKQNRSVDKRKDRKENVKNDEMEHGQAKSVSRQEKGKKGECDERFDGGRTGKTSQ
jgi:hypothetical protein